MDYHENELAAHYWYWQSCRSLVPDSGLPKTIVDTRMLYLPRQLSEPRTPADY